MVTDNVNRGLFHRSKPRWAFNHLKGCRHFFFEYAKSLISYDALYLKKYVQHRTYCICVEHSQIRGNRLSMLRMLRILLFESVACFAVYTTWYLTSLKKTLKIVVNKSTSDLQVSRKEPPDTLPAYDTLREINAQLLEIERQKAKAIWSLYASYSFV